MKFMNWVRLLVAILGLSAPVASFATVTYTVGNRVGPYAVGGYVSEILATLALTGTYASNGFTLRPASFGLSHIQSAMFQGPSYQLVYRPSTGKVIVYQVSTSTGLLSEVAESTDLSSLPFNVNAVIKGR